MDEIENASGGDALAADAPPEQTSVAATVDAALKEAAEPKTPLEATQAALDQTAEPAPEQKASEQEAALPEQQQVAETELPPEQQEWRASHEQLQKFDAMLTERGLSGDDLRNAVDLVSALKGGDPAKALEMLAPLWQAVQAAAGEVLPPELQQAVDAGHLDPEYAKHLAKQLAGGQSAEQRLAADRQRNEAAEAERFQTQMVGTATGWERKKAETDPEFKARADLVKEVVQARVYADPPKTAADLLKMLDQADADVRAKFPKVQRPATQVQPTPTRGGVARSGPRSIADNIDDILNGAA